MTDRQILAQLRLDFIYHADGRLDTWGGFTGPGAIYGDCEDFALALAWRLAGGSWRRFLWDLLICRSVIWHCRTDRDTPHAALWRRGSGWADNINPIWAPRAQHKRRFPWIPPLAFLKLVLSPVFAWLNSKL